jgi:hypothetical protein
LCRDKKLVVPLQPIAIDTPFEQNGLDIIGEINGNFEKQHKYSIENNGLIYHMDIIHSINIHQ